MSRRIPGAGGCAPMILIAVAITAIIALLLISGNASAQAMCMPYPNFVKTLNDRFGETSMGKGVAGETVVIELFASPDTFTLLATNTQGQACIIAAGKGWEAENKPLKPKENET